MSSIGTSHQSHCHCGLVQRHRIAFSSSIRLLRLLCLCFLLLMTAVDAVKYAKICELQSSPPVTLEYDAATGQYSLVDNDSDSDNDDGASPADVFNRDVRKLTVTEGEGRRSRTVQIGKQHNMNINSMTNYGGSKRTFLRANSRDDANTAMDSRLLQTESAPATSDGDKQRYIIARSCPCDDTGRTYCLVDGISPGTAVPDSCGVPWNNENYFLGTGSHGTSGSSNSNFTAYNTHEIGCFELNGQTVFIRNAWPVVVLWYGALFIFLIATSNGKYARAYILNALCPKLFRTNERTVDRIMERENAMRGRLRVAALRTNPHLAQYMVRTRGVRLPSRGAYRSRDGMTEEERRREATRWWIEQAEHLGILSIHEDGEVGADGVSPTGSVTSQPPQRMEYVLRTKTFNAEKERARIEEIRRRTSKSEAKDVPSDASKEPIVEPETGDVEEGEVEKPSTPDTVITTLSADKLIPTESENETASPEQNLLSENDEDESFECTICLTEIEEGERVGILPCTHVFHVDCLQQWVTRRNVCPLCQVTEIARSRPVELEEADEVLSSIVSTSSEGVLSNNGTEEAGGTTTDNSNDTDRPAPNTRSRFMPSFFFPASNNDDNNGDVQMQQQRRTASTPTRLTLSTSTSMSDNGRRDDLSPSLSLSSGDHNRRRRGGNRGNGGQRPHRGRRRRDRRSQDFLVIAR